MDMGDCCDYCLLNVYKIEDKGEENEEKCNNSMWC